jgi:hypothetical protein
VAADAPRCARPRRWPGALQRCRTPGVRRCSSAAHNTPAHRLTRFLFFRPLAPRRAAPALLAATVSLCSYRAQAPRQPCSASLGGAHAVGAASEAASLFTPVVSNGNGATIDASIAPWQRKTKVVCTIGPATADRENLFKLADAGMNVARCVSGAAHPRVHAPAATAAAHSVPRRCCRRRANFATHGPNPAWSHTRAPRAAARARAPRAPPQRPVQTSR